MQFTWKIKAPEADRKIKNSIDDYIVRMKKETKEFVAFESLVDVCCVPYFDFDICYPTEAEAKAREAVDIKAAKDAVEKKYPNSQQIWHSSFGYKRPAAAESSLMAA